MSKVSPSNISEAKKQSQFRLFIDMMRDHFNKSYFGLSRWTIGLMLFAFAYLILPFDFDWLFPFGYIDDAVVIGFVIKHIKKEIVKYQIWKSNN